MTKLIIERASKKSLKNLLILKLLSRVYSKTFRFCGFVLALFAVNLAATGQENPSGDDFDADAPAIFSPLEQVGLDFPENDGEELPALQPDFVAPPLPNNNFPAALLQEQPTQEAVLRLDAHLSPSSPPLVRGLVWRVFGAEIGLDNQLPLIDSKQGGMAEFRLPEGDYFVHVAFGRVEAIQKLTLEAGRTYYENIEMDAGGVTLNVETPGRNINKNRIRFAIYGHADDAQPQRLIVEDVRPDTVVRLKAGSYHVVSTYGDANAITSADIRIEAGKLTQVTIEHYAGQVTLKLVRESGAEALADTSWVIMNASGDTVREIANPHVDIVLAEGDYIAYARNREQSYAREFSVSAGEDIALDLLISRDRVEADAL